MRSTTTERPGWWTRTDPLGLRAVTGERASLTLLLMLIGVILYSVARHLRAAATGGDPLLFLDTPLGYPEAFQTLQWLWAIGLVALIAVLLRRWAFAALLPLLVFMVLTDTFELHERYGRRLAEALAIEPMLGLRSQDFGELLVLGGAALVTVPIALIGLWRAGSADRVHFLRILVLLGLVLFCGVALDAVHILVVDDPGPGDAFGIIEDGGEMLGASLLVAYLFWLWLTRGRTAEPGTASAEAAATPTMVG